MKKGSKKAKRLAEIAERTRMVADWLTEAASGSEPPFAKFHVHCEPSGRIMYVRSQSFAGACRTAKHHQYGKKDRAFTAHFDCWERGALDPARTGEPPQDDYHSNAEHDTRRD